MRPNQSFAMIEWEGKGEGGGGGGGREMSVLYSTGEF